MASFALPDDHLARVTEGQSGPDHAPATEEASTDSRARGEGAEGSDRILRAVRPEATVPVDIALIDRHVIQLFALVENAVAGATHAMVSGDHEAARILVAADADIDDLYQEARGFRTGAAVGPPLGSGRDAVPVGGARDAPGAGAKR